MLRVAVIGVGHWGPHLVRCLSANPAVQLAAVVDSDLERARAVAPRGVEVFASLAQTPRASLDAVVIATPAATHTALVREALEAGLHVLVEKPLASSVTDAELLATLAQEHERTLMVGHVFLFHPAVVAVKAALSDLGALRVITMERLNLGPVRRDVGAVFDLLAHEVSILEAWLDTAPAQVSAVGGQWLPGGGVDSVAATLSWPTGVVAHLHASWLHPVKKRAVSVVGERGMLTWDELDRAAPLRWFGSTVEGTTPRPVDPRVIEVPAAEPLQAEVDHFVACLTGGHAVRSDARFGARVVRTLAAIEASMAQAGAPVRP